MRNPNLSVLTKDSSLLSLVKRNWRSLFVLVALLVDAAAILSSNFVALFAYGLHSPGAPSLSLPAYLDSSLFFVAVFLFLGLLLGLYRAAYYTKTQQQYFLGATVYFYGSLATLAILFTTHHTEYARFYVLFFLVALPPCFLLFRSALQYLNRLMQRKGYGVYNALIVEQSNKLNEVLYDRFEIFPELGYRLLAHVTKGKKGENGAVHETLSELEHILEEQHIDSVFIPTLDIIENGYSELIGFCEERNVKLKLLSRESDDLLRFAYVKDLAGISLFAPPKRKTERVKAIAKRVFDVAFAVIGLVMLSPVFLLVSIAIVVEDGFPIFFRQTRGLSKGGRTFGFLKFRSMHNGAEHLQEDLYKRNARTGGLFLVHDDPRLTRVGRFIRKFSLDELPQLFNVLAGDMSLVGPRPLSTIDLENIAPENQLGGYYALREKGTPGMTGLWQISGRREVGFREMVLLDLYYLEHQTILFDLEILAQTIPVVLFGKGGY
jgi:exopolysaccharide biosynthesis polyprenyl glycosylphosphotransferase